MSIPPKSFNLKVLTREKVLHDGEVSYVGVPGIQGEQGFLPDHAGFITGLRQGDITIHPANTGTNAPHEEKKIPIIQGHAFFHNNSCVICVACQA